MHDVYSQRRNVRLQLISFVYNANSDTAYDTFNLYAQEITILDADLVA